MFIEATHKNLDSYLLDVQNPIAMTWLAVHDELDLVIDYNLAKPLMKKITTIGHCKREINQLSPVPFINFIFDTEFDDYGSFTAGKNLGLSNDIPEDRTENYAYLEYKKLRDMVVAIDNNEPLPQEKKVVKQEIADKTITTSTEDTENVVVIPDSKIFSLILDIINELPDGETEIRFHLSNGKKVIGKRKVDISQFDSAFQKFFSKK